MRLHLTSKAKILATALLAVGLFAGGYVAGQNRFGEPRTIIHVVEIKWRPGVPAAEKARVLAGIKTMAAQIPGVKNIWLKADRLEPRDFDAAFAIEFRDRDAADAYAESPIHKAWDNQYVPLRDTSVSIQVTNP
ncbi:MAG TPA: Dabb family protein [Candidatus Acidoferrales bacterium]|nr:Dabb family protein [Candidatus Acidoferrales bacterium]